MAQHRTGTAPSVRAGFPARQPRGCRVDQPLSHKKEPFLVIRADTGHTTLFIGNPKKVQTRLIPINQNGMGTRAILLNFCSNFHVNRWSQMKCRWCFRGSFSGQKLWEFSGSLVNQAQTVASTPLVFLIGLLLMTDFFGYTLELHWD